MSRTRRESTRIRPRLEGFESRIVLDAAAPAVAATTVAETATTTATTATPTPNPAAEAATATTAATTTTTDATAAASRGPTLAFRTPQATLFSQQAAEADITLALRSPQALRKPVDVRVQTVEGADAGTAVANQHYRPVDQVITFQPGQATRVVAIPLIPGASNPGQVTVDLKATIQDANAFTTATQVTIADIPDRSGPQIIDADLVVVDRAVKGIQITFNEPMNARTLEKVANYTVWDFSKKPSVGDWVGSILSGGKNDAFAPTPVRLRAAVYDADARSVLLVPKQRLLPTGQYDVTSGFRAPKPSVKPRKGGPSDTQGNLLGYFHISVGTPNKANSAGTKTASILSKFPHF
ncbi:MAG: Calx-beta domain-containing protein [Isosphaeraceae bacterium]